MDQTQIGLIFIIGMIAVGLLWRRRAKSSPGGVSALTLSDTQSTSLLSSDASTRFKQLYQLNADGLTYSPTVIATVGANVGAANFDSNQVTLNATPKLIVAARATRRGVVVKNIDAAIVVFVVKAGVSTPIGLQLKAGESVAIDTTAAVYGVPASGSPIVSYAETYD